MARASLTSHNAGRWIAAQYDFAVHGGEVGSIPLRVTVPAGAVVVNSLLHVLTAPTSGGSATIAISLESAGDILAATAFDAAPFDGTFGLGLARYRPTVVQDEIEPNPWALDESSAAAFVATTAERQLTLTIATAALTAGKINVFLNYVVNAAA